MKKKKKKLDHLSILEVLGVIFILLHIKVPHITARSNEKKNMQVTFENGLEDIIDSSSSDVYTLAEATGAFFEAYRHVLEGLQEFGSSPHDFPMSRYLVDCNKQVMMAIVMMIKIKITKMRIMTMTAMMIVTIVKRRTMQIMMAVMMRRTRIKLL